MRRELSRFFSRVPRVRNWRLQPRDDASGEDTECDGFPSGWSDQGNYQGTNQPLVPRSDYSSATRSIRVGVAHFVVVALIVVSFEVIDYTHRFGVNIRCREP